MCENICIDESEYIIDWRNGYIMIIDLDKSQYIRFWIDDVNDNIKALLKDLLFKKVIKKALNNECGKWKSFE